VDASSLAGTKNFEEMRMLLSEHRNVIILCHQMSGKRVIMRLICGYIVDVLYASFLIRIYTDSGTSCLLLLRPDTLLRIVRPSTITYRDIVGVVLPALQLGETAIVVLFPNDGKGSVRVLEDKLVKRVRG